MQSDPAPSEPRSEEAARTVALSAAMVTMIRSIDAMIEDTYKLVKTLKARYGEDISLFMMGHSWGGMVITGVAEKAPERIRRLVYWNAMVPNDGESLIDLLPPHMATMFGGSVRNFVP